METYLKSIRKLVAIAEQRFDEDSDEISEVRSDINKVIEDLQHIESNLITLTGEKLSDLDKAQARGSLDEE